ncbi:MAG: S8 family serine peptidase [Dongiaceae bacterium]
MTPRVLILAGLLLLALPVHSADAQSSTTLPKTPTGSSDFTATPPPPPPTGGGSGVPVDPAGGGSVPGGPAIPDPATGTVPPPTTPPTVVTPAFVAPETPTVPVPIPGAATAVADELLVVSRSIAEATALAQALAPRGYRVLRRQPLSFLGGALTAFRLPPGQSLGGAVTELGQDFPDHIVAPNGLLTPAATEPAAQLYAKTLIGWRAAPAKCRAAQPIGLIDTPVDMKHPALSGQKLASRSFLPAGMKPGSAEHGTAVAALLIGRENEKSFGGLLPGAALQHAGVFHATDDRPAVATVERVVAAVDWLGGGGIRLVNMSLETGSNPVLDFAMGSAADKGMILVAAAGNGGKDAPAAYPAAHPDVIAVTAIDADARIYKKANRGDYIDLAAPGVDVWAAKAGGGGSYRSGTSFAVPFVVAAIAIEQSAMPNATAKQLLAKLRAAAQDLGAKGHDPIFGSGLLTAPRSCGGASASN